MDYRIFIPNYADNRFSTCFADTRFSPLELLDKEKTDNSREYSLFRRIFEQFPELEAFGILPPSFERKCGISLIEFADFASEHLGGSADFVAINPMLGSEALYKNCFDQAISCGHKDFDTVQNALAALLNNARAVSGFLPVGGMLFCNYFIASRPWWNRYLKFCDLILSSLRELSYPRLKRALNEPSGYTKNEALIGSIFLEERLLSIFYDWCLQRPVQFRGLVFEQYRRRLNAKFPPALAEFLERLLTLKISAAKSADDYDRWVRMLATIDERMIWLIWNLDDPPEFPTTAT